MPMAQSGSLSPSAFDCSSPPAPPAPNWDPHLGFCLETELLHLFGQPHNEQEKKIRFHDYT
ncbi:MAG: hypothetical protein CVU64_17715 [Deltaproteobacteria bacterium HGW-Deltaproteobacteria-21]|nr:MAG: hypothetical protein CVU64_17715 [Deltaproteobacteria bacterium HGW-Deltaproteobacteria-21]